MPNISKCPSCDMSLYSELEKGSHRCPSDDSHAAQDLARMESLAMRAQRAAIMPTREKLQEDAGKAVQQLHDFWDGEVEVMVIFRAKGSKEVISANSFTNRDNVRVALKAILAQIPYQKSLKT